MKLELKKQNNKGKTYQSDDFKICYRNAGTTAGDNEINIFERIYLITGKARVTIGEAEQLVEAPAYFEIPAKTYHKIEALEDISFIMFV